jgi:hypothetical protein
MKRSGGRGFTRLFQLVALSFLVSVAASSPAYSDRFCNCDLSVRGCSGSCCFICYLTTISFYPDSCDCNYDDCYTNCI